jgi:hypothetical protein
VKEQADAEKLNLIFLDYQYLETFKVAFVRSSVVMASNKQGKMVSLLQALNFGVLSVDSHS